MIYNGNCLDILPTLDDNSVNMVFCDLPYGTTACKWDSIIPLNELWEQYNRVVKEDGAFIMTSAQPFTTTLISSNIENFKYSMVYQKTYATNWMSAKKRPMPDHEDVCIFYRKQPTYNPQMVWNGKAIGYKHSGKAEIYDAQHKDSVSDRGQAKDRYPRTVLGPYGPAKTDLPKSLKDEGYKCHPTQKQQELIKWFINSFSNEGDTILDNCMGSGSTGVACKSLNREFIGIEKDPKYFEMAGKWINMTSPLGIL